MKIAEKEVPMQNSEIEIIKRSLLLQKSEILNKHQEFKALQTTSSKASDEADAVAQDMQDNLNIQLHERDQQSLVLIDKALAKFSLGSYGQCEACEEQIDLRRLKARPLATLCISCMEDRETLGQSSFQ